MRIFSSLYRLVLRWSEHRHAPYYLAGVSFAESSIFPVPPDVMLISMSLAKPKQAWRYAAVATISSVLGGMLGYVIGAFLFKLIYPYIVSMGYLPAFNEVSVLFKQWGIWIIFIAGFTPIPYKIFTISAGTMRMAFLPFVIASMFGRAGRFFLLATVLYWGGEHINRLCTKYIDLIGFLILGLCLIGFIVYKIMV